MAAPTILTGKRKRNQISYAEPDLNDLDDELETKSEENLIEDDTTYGTQRVSSFPMIRHHYYRSLFLSGPWRTSQVRENSKTSQPTRSKETQNDQTAEAFPLSLTSGRAPRLHLRASAHQQERSLSWILD